MQNFKRSFTTERMITLIVYTLFLLSSICIGSSTSCSQFKQKEGVHLECRLPGTGQMTNCYNGELPPGTTVKYSCAPNYLPGNADLKNGQLSCTSRNRWSGRDQYTQFGCRIDCGRSYEEIASFVVAGEEADPYDWPWHASIFARKSQNSKFEYICGGTLVKPYSQGFIIISAAHCLTDVWGKARDVKNVKVLLGANFSTWEDNDGLRNVQRHEVRQIVIHDSYQGSSDFQADIAIISVKDPIKLSSHVLPACFQGGEDLAELGAVGTVVGFGFYEYNNPTVSKSLRLAKLPVVQKDKCVEWRRRKLLPSEICAGYEKSQAVCNGDSGGGLVFPKSVNKVERFYLEGIVSHGRKNVNSKEACDHYSVFTKVSAYDNWIRMKAEEMFSEDLEDVDVAPEEPQQKLGSPTTSTTTSTTTRRPTTASQIVVPQSPTVRPTPPPPVVAPVPQNPNDFTVVGLERHNYYRRRHGVPDLRLTDHLNRHAQAYAELLLREGGLKNDYEKGINKNVYRHIGRQVRGVDAVRAAVDHWYSAIMKYDWNRPMVSTFSQVVWKSTTEIGVGFAGDQRTGYVVVSYTPPGNLNGEGGRHYHENVFPVQQSIGE